MDDRTASAVANTFSRQDQARNAGLDPLYETIEASLAAMEREYEAECAKISQSRHDAPLKLRIMSKVDREYRERRAPYLLQLSLLKERILVGANEARCGCG